MTKPANLDEAMRLIKEYKLERSELMGEIKELKEEIAEQYKEIDGIKEELDRANERLAEIGPD